MSAATDPKRQPATKKPTLRLVPPPPKLSAANAREHAAAEAKVTKARKELDDAEAAREKLRKRDRRKLPPGEEIVVGGLLLKRTTWKARSFSLTDYEDGGNKITAAMKRHISRSSRERWTVKPVK